MFRSLLGIAAAAAWLHASTGLLLAQAGLDQVYAAKGGIARGVLTNMSATEVTLNVSGSDRTIAVNDIARISFADEPSELNQARVNVAQKNYRQALEELKKVNPAKLDREFIKQDVQFFQALCLGKLALNEGGDKKVADKALLDFARGGTKNYHFFEAAELAAELAMAMGNYDDAVKRYNPIVNNAPWPEYKLRGQIAQGRALLGQKNYAEAQQRFDEAIASDLTSAEANSQKALARVGKDICLAEQGQVDEAVKDLESIIEKFDPSDARLFARTYNALGRCYLKQNKNKEALLAFLHVDVLFYADGDAHAEALHYLTKLWDAANRADRSLAARNTLRERYAGSVWSEEKN